MKQLKFLLVIVAALALSGCEAALNKPADETFSMTDQTESSPSIDQPAEATTEVDPDTSPEETPAPTPTEEPIPTEEPQPEETPAPTETVLPEDVQSPYGENYGDPSVDGGLSNQKMGWYFMKNSEHQPPTAQRDFDIRQFDSYYLGDISTKTLYLTLDQGYENGYTTPILDVLKEKNVPAAFFMTQTYIRDNSELVIRMVNEGHIVANHSVSHPSFPDISNDEISYEINETARYFQEITGQEMPKFFRPPSGEYSARVLGCAQSLGWKTIFWSFAYVDWLVDDQPGRDVAYQNVMDNLHNGAIILLHAVSSSNTEALPDIIDDARAQGYEFKSLYELP